MNRRPVHIHIDELVLAGFSASDRYRIQDAVQRALGEMLASGAMPLPHRLEALDVDAARPQAATLHREPSPREVGSVVARSVLGGIGSVLAGVRSPSR